MYAIQLQSGKYVGRQLHGFRGIVPLERAGTFAHWSDALNAAAPFRRIGARIVELASDNPPTR